MTRNSSVLWRRLDRPGHEAAKLVAVRDGWSLSGSAVFLDADAPCRLDYLVACDASWRTTAAQVRGWIGGRVVSLDIAVDQKRQWLLNSTPCVGVTGCFDVDLSFSPSTNMLPLRRLRPEIGAAVKLDAAWLEFPSLTLQRLDQVYRRGAGRQFRFESGGGSFAADLVVNDDSWVVDYPGQWRLIGSA